ncbi:MAG: aspartate--tRNA ligase [Candidatus Woesearchaeota archaeon]
MLRTHTCGELTSKEVNKDVTLSGWVHSRRDHGGVIFIDLRDRYGITQIVINPDNEHFSEADKLRREDVIQVKGKVRHRPEGMTNPKILTGEIEVLVKHLITLNKSESPPLEVEDRVIAGEDARLKYRYLDLRRPVMQKNLQLRHNLAQAAREYLNKHHFLEIETPLLIRATPEGARDYVVPSRIHPGKIFALPQSPQLYKQILMVSGCDRYYQLARCLRDEDLRADRQPEFTQIDVEMSFIEEEDIYEVVEGLIKHMLKKAADLDIATPFPRISYDEAIDLYGVDKPDIRFNLHLHDITEIAKKADFNVFKQAELVKCINPDKDFTRGEIEELTKIAQEFGAKGLAWVKVTSLGFEGGIAKFLENMQKDIIKKIGAKPGTTILFIADSKKATNDILGGLRKYLGEKLNLYKKEELKFCWVTDFNLFEWDEEAQKWAPAHHIFTSPKPEHIQYLESDPAKVKGILYDLVLNGIELLSGSIRINRPDIQERVMAVIGLKKEDAEKKFGFLLEAFRYGAPPHGGFAIGFDRLVALLSGTNDIREVIAFPKTKATECPMDSCPTAWEDDQLKELHIQLDPVAKKNITKQ